MHIAILKAVCIFIFSKTFSFFKRELKLLALLHLCIVVVVLVSQFSQFFSPICVILRFFVLFCAFLRFSRFLAFQNSNDCCLAHDVIWVSHKKNGQNFLETLLAAVQEGEVHLPLLSCLQSGSRWKMATTFFSKMACSCWSKRPQNSDEMDPEAVRNHVKVPEQYRIGKYDADQ